MCGQSRIALVTGVLILSGIHGCSSSAVPPANAPRLENQSISELTFALDGADPSSESVQLRPGQVCHVTASYVRRCEPDDVWHVIVMLIVEEPPGRHPFGIVLNRALGLRGQERMTPGGKRTWTCQGFDGSTGKTMPFPKAPGQYELRLCWAWNPATVAEKRVRGDDPFQFLTPFYRASIEIKDE